MLLQQQKKTKIQTHTWAPDQRNTQIQILYLFSIYVYRAYMRVSLYQFAACQVSPGMKCWSNALIYLHARTFTKLLRHFSNTQFHIKCCTALLLLFLRVFLLCFNFFFFLAQSSFACLCYFILFFSLYSHLLSA